MKNLSYSALLVLPPEGKKNWTELMEGSDRVPEAIDPGSPIVQAYSRYIDGTQVIIGVVKSHAPKEYNCIFGWVFDCLGNQYPDWPIDLSDCEDFYIQQISFSLKQDNYLLNIVEQPSV